MKVSTKLCVLCSPLLLLATIAGAKEKGAASATASRNLAMTTVCYDIQQNPNGGIQVTPGPGAPPVPTSYFMNVFPQGVPPAPAPAPQPVFQPAIQGYPTTWTAVTEPRAAPVPQPVPAPVPPSPSPKVPTLGVPSPGGVTVPIPSPPSPDTISFPTEPHHGCVEGAMQVWDDNEGGWTDIECPHSCTGCYGVKVHTADCNDASNQNLCVPPRWIDGRECGWCGESGSSATNLDAVPEEETAPASGAFVSSGYTRLMVLGFSTVVSTFAAVWA